MYYTIYEIKNLLTNEIYIGQHTTKNINDEYYGSGLIISQQIKKYGKENFAKTILFVFDNFEDMDNKEAEIVTEEFIKRLDVLNIIPGGVGYKTANTVVCRKIGETNYRRISSEQFYSNQDSYEAVSKGKLRILDSNGFKTIDSIDYDKSKHKTPSSGKVSIVCKDSGKTMSIKLEDFDDAIHKKVFGGIVATKDGINQYVSKEEFESLNLSGAHKNKVTAYDKFGILRHVDKEEYFRDKQKYKHVTEGTVIVKHKVTGECKRIPKEFIDLHRELYYISTEGFRTVFSINDRKFKNIPASEFDKDLHKLAQDKKFIVYNKDGDVILEYWGNKKDFLSAKKLPERFWNCLIKNQSFYTKDKTLIEYDGCYFKLIDWKKEYEL